MILSARSHWQHIQSTPSAQGGAVAQKLLRRHRATHQNQGQPCSNHVLRPTTQIEVDPICWMIIFDGKTKIFKKKLGNSIKTILKPSVWRLSSCISQRFTVARLRLGRAEDCEGHGAGHFPPLSPVNLVCWLLKQTPALTGQESTAWSRQCSRSP